MHVFLVRVWPRSYVLSVSINKTALETPSTYQLNGPDSYFNVGNYNQGDTSTEVHAFDIKCSH